MIATIDYEHLATQIKQWGKELGFAEVGICDLDLQEAGLQFREWIKKGYHGEMKWLENHHELRTQIDLLVPYAVRVISVLMPYLSEDNDSVSALEDTDRAYISRYALGRDYHKILRKRLKHLAEKIKSHCETLNYRPFVDSAPLLERPLAQKAGLGWQGKHTLILNQQGSWFFLGELVVSIPLPVDNPVIPKCGKCQACLQICPTSAIVAPYILDARRCISYLTIEFDGVIPIPLRPLIGNRIYGCDDCQLICPWNHDPKTSSETDFMPRHALDNVSLISLYGWDETTFYKQTEGSAIRRIGYAKWLRNITVALGNAPYRKEIIDALQSRLGLSDLVDTHIFWAIEQQEQRQFLSTPSTQKQKRLLRQLKKR